MEAKTISGVYNSSNKKKQRQFRALKRLESILPIRVKTFENFLSKASDSKLLLEMHMTKDSAAKELAQMGKDIDRINQEIQTLKSKI